MKDKILTFIIGLLVGAIIASACFLIYAKTNNNSKGRMLQGEPPTMSQSSDSNGRGQSGMPQPPSGGNDQSQNGMSNPPSGGNGPTQNNDNSQSNSNSENSNTK